MAFTVTELFFNDLAAGTGGVCVLSGKYVNTAGSTGGTILPGNEAGAGISITPARGLRVIHNVQITPSTSTATVPYAAISFNGTQQGDIVTLTTGANDSGTFRIEGENNGA